MIIELPKNASKKQIKDAIKKIETATNKKKSGGNVAKLFGANPNEIDGLSFQKNIRKEWQ